MSTTTEVILTIVILLFAIRILNFFEGGFDIGDPGDDETDEHDEITK